MTQAALNTFTVSVGNPVFIGTVNDSALLYNNSSDTAVYVGPSSSVSSSVGIRIGPLGSLSWQGTSLAWLVLDPAAKHSVTVTISDSAVNPNSPLDVAEALAAAGIPSKLLIDYLGTWDVPNGVSSLPIDLTGYAMIYLTVNSTDSSNIDDIQMYWATLYDNGEFEFTTTPYILKFGDGLLVIPAFFSTVEGQYLTFDNPNADGSCTVQLSGYNRQLSLINYANQIQPYGESWNLSLSSGGSAGSYIMTLVGGSLNQGLVNIAVRCSYGQSGVVPWVLRLSVNNETRDIMYYNELQYYNRFTFVGSKLIALPATFYGLYVNLDVDTANSFGLHIDIIPAATP